jgi:hypothetical protein
MIKSEDREKAPRFSWEFEEMVWTLQHCRVSRYLESTFRVLHVLLLSSTIRLLDEESFQ